MELRYIGLFLVILAVILYVVGGLIGEKCVSINDNKACWKTTSTVVTSDLCPDPTQPCLAKPEAQQHNAITDLLLKACSSASPSYSDAELNNRIVEVANNFLGYSLDVRGYCDQPGVLFSKVRYG